jgi:uncharacterized membrane protein
MRHSASFILFAAFVTACAPRSDQPDDSAATEPDVVTAEDSAAAVPPGPAFRLLGNEPFWNLQIDSTGIVFRTIEDTAGNRFPATQPVMVGDTLRWNSVNEVSEVEAIVVPQECSDTMSDRKWPYRAIVIIDRRRLRGCAERR